MTTNAAVAFASVSSMPTSDPYAEISPADLRSCVNLAADDQQDLLEAFGGRALRIKTVARRLGWLHGRALRACRASANVTTLGELAWRTRSSGMSHTYTR